MRRVLPSDVVEVIDEQFGWTRGWSREIAQREASRNFAVSLLPGILRLIEAIPEELIFLSPAENSRLILATAALEEAAGSGRNNPGAFTWPTLINHIDCLAIVRGALQKCPDEAPSKSTRQLEFITDSSFRQTLGVDLGSVERALTNGEWKAATVLGGSVIEALLLWAIKQHTEADRSAAMVAAVAAKRLQKMLQVNDLNRNS